MATVERAEGLERGNHMQTRRWVKRVCRPWLPALAPLLLILAAVAASDPQTASASPQAHQDWGDASEAYPTTLADNGARHDLESDVYLGGCVDAEPDGQPTIDADGDDTHIGSPVYGTCAHGSDEDGVIFVSPLFTGGTADIVVVASEACTLSAWLDFNADGDWSDAGEDLFPGGQALVAGANPLTFTIPEGKAVHTYARFRCTTYGPVSYTGEASDGEVEDYEVTITSEMDFGDAPDPPYPTLNEIEAVGAVHYLGSDVYLGSCVDAEVDGQPTVAADGDDVNDSSAVYGTCEYGDDEDGVTFATDLLAGQTAALTATANSTCTLSAWIDFNRNGDWWDESEELFLNGRQLAPGENLLFFPVPSYVAPGLSYARFRCTTYGAVGPDGYAFDGEVEDYRVWLGPPLDFGDAPDPGYPTLETGGGAAHVLGSDVYLGTCVDAELDGQPTLAANGDDVNAGDPVFGTCTENDDEDGVTFTTNLLAGEVAEIEVMANADCTLSAWIDFDADGDWWDTGEELFPGGRSIVSGTSTLSFTMPGEVTEGPTYARFRCTTDVVDGPVGLASDGEVEDYRVRLGSPLDFGDAPDPTYATLITNTGASHVLGSDVYLGTCVDAEFDGQPAFAANGDDVAVGSPVFGTCTENDDEDGVIFTTDLLAGATAEVEVVANADCTLSAWVDFNADGDWADAGESLFPGGRSLVIGSNVLSFAVPAGAAQGTTHARFRCTTDGAVAFTGEASDGEVEDYHVSIGHHLDLGDVPDPGYPTLLASTGASHVLGSDVYLGDCVDAELDGQPTTDAIGDDLNVGSPVYGSCARITDEDGVGFVTPLYPGGTTNIVVRAHAACTLSGWVDFNRDGDWSDGGESLFPSGEPLTAGLNPLSFAVPVGAAQGATYARLRCTTDGAVEPTGEASDGEVEDYRVVIGPPVDFGDAPDANYLTLLASGGASHVLGSDVYLGSCVDAEGDGQPTAAAGGDDTGTGAPVFGTCTDDDDEDGVTFTSNLLAGQQADVEVVANTACMLSGWVDFNADGDWADVGETLFPVGQPLVAGTNYLTFAVPVGAVEGPTHARFRCTTAGVVTFAGPAINGEVEDYQVNIGASLDFGDAPEPYPTSLEVDGPSHALGNGVYLGSCVDAEGDGQPTIAADGDDANATQPAFGVCTAGDDEDGVTFPRPLLAGETAEVEVIAGAACTLSAWVDFNGDGDWDDGDENLFPGGQSLAPGSNTLTFTVPASVELSNTYARFRCTSGGAVEPTGAAPDGEVEDYQVTILVPTCHLPLVVRDYVPPTDAVPASRYRKSRSDLLNP
jgi:hypothetical protein